MGNVIASYCIESQCQKKKKDTLQVIHIVIGIKQVFA